MSFRWEYLREQVKCDTYRIFKIAFSESRSHTIAEIKGWIRVVILLQFHEYFFVIIIFQSYFKALSLGIHHTYRQERERKGFPT